MDQYREFVFAKLSTGGLNEIQVDYLMNCMDANGDMGACLNDLNLTAEYRTFQTQQLTHQQEFDYQKTLLTDKIKSCREEIEKRTKELALLSPKLTALLHDSTILDARYKNFPENPSYITERNKILNAMNDIQLLMNPLEAQVENLTTDLESLQLAAT